MLIASLAALLALQPAAPAEPAGAASFVRAEDHRVAEIGYRMGLAGRPFCAEPYPLTGLLLQHLGEYAAADQKQAMTEFGLDRGPGVLAVVAGSPAARAGLAAGDIMLAVNGAPLAPASGMPRPGRGDAARRAVEAVEGRIEAELRKGPARLTVARGGDELTVELSSVAGCPARVRLARSGQMNAFANRGYAIVTTALLGFIRSDDELAVVLGHELGHVILKHPEQLEAEGVPGRGFLRAFGKNGSRVRATEIAADGLGLRLASAAGYDAAAAIPYWRRYYASFDSLPRLFRTHPGLRERERLAQETLAELRAGGSDAGAERP
ncbi:MAG TPA: M48 family metallopeptidase [Allosphingosinicella sp.]